MSFRQRPPPFDEKPDPVGQRGEESPYRRDSHDQQNDRDNRVDQWADNLALQSEEISLFTPRVMQQEQRHDQVDGLMQSFPGLAESFLPNIERSHRKRNQHQETGKPYKDIRLLDNGLDDQTPRKAVVEIDEDDHVDGGIHECVQPKRAAAFEQFAPSEEGVERRARDRHD